MIVSTCIITVVLINIIPFIDSQGPPAADPPAANPPVGNDVLGGSACSYWGDPIPGCPGKLVPVDKLPAECTSFIYDRVMMDANNTLEDYYKAEGYLDKLLLAGKKVHIMFSHYHQQEWFDVIKESNANGGETANAEMASLKVYTDKHKGISGIILDGLISDGKSTSDIPVNEDLNAFIAVVKSKYPDMAIGISVDSSILNIFYASPVVNALDFSIVDANVDYYVMRVRTMDKCTAELKDTGIIPITGTSSVTMVKIIDFMVQAKIPEDKTHYLYELTAKAIDNKGGCDLTYTEICTKANGSETWCADTQQLLRDKGKFSGEYGAGFIAKDVDTDDSEGVCCTGTPFPAFHFLLDGYNAQTTATSCPLFDRTP